MIGSPIKHSRSPQIHQAFAQQTGFDLDYQLRESAPDQFIANASEFRDLGGAGMNVTVPFKEQAFAWADDCSNRARCAGAVNTLKFQPDGSVYGDNTDGAGLVRDLTERHQQPLNGTDILLLGAGGAARGVVQPLLDSGVGRIVVINRTVARAHALVEHAQQYANKGQAQLLACGFNEVNRVVRDLHQPLIINATAGGLSGQAPPLPPEILATAAIAYDMVYAGTDTAFMAQAHANGVDRVVDGLGMLLEQAAESFQLWLGVRPQTAAVYRLIRQELTASAR